MPEGKAHALYERLATDREPFLIRARDCSKHTIPSLIPPAGQGVSAKLPQPYSSVGARGVNNLAGKLLITLLPPSSGFFRYLPDQSVLQQIRSQEQGDQTEGSLETTLEEALSDMETAIHKDIERRALRAPANEGFKHLIVGGNCLMYLPRRKKKTEAPKSLRVFPLSMYVTDRDHEGNVMDIIVKECVSPRTLPFAIRAVVESEMKEKSDTDVDLYTWIRREEDQWKIHQEVKGVIVPDSEGTYPLDKCPWIPLRWTRIDGESYGRGLCEEYYGDLTSHESLSQSVILGSAAAARVLILVNPAGHTKLRDVQNAPNLAVRAGHKDDITVASLEKYADFSVAMNTAAGIEKRLEQAFLLNSSVQRDGERVTAEEIRFLAKELEDALGGVYSVLSSEFQLPLVQLVQAQMEHEGSLPTLPSGSVSPTIVAGLDALGRTHELERLDAFVGGAVQVLGPQVVQAIIPEEYMKRRAVALGVKPKGLIKTAEQMQAEQQAAMQSQVAQKLGPAAIKAVSDHSLAAQQQTQPPSQ